MHNKAKKILVVDDDVINLEVLHYMLEDTDFELVFARDAEEAFERLHEFDISLILLDRMMPGMSGVELTRKLRANPKFADIPIIMQSAAAYKAQIEEGFESGVNEYLTKPYDKEALDAVIAKYQRA